MKSESKIYIGGIGPNKPTCDNCYYYHCLKLHLIMSRVLSRSYYGAIMQTLKGMFS